MSLKEKFLGKVSLGKFMKCYYSNGSHKEAVNKHLYQMLTSVIPSAI